MRSIRLIGSLLVRSRPSHWSPDSFPSAPQTPLHFGILIHLSGFQVLHREFICRAKLLVSLVALRSPDIGVIVGGVREDIIRFSVLLDHGYLPRRKRLKFLLLRCRLGCDHLKAGCYQHALSVLRAGLCASAAG